jgi:hypothetical protein
MELYSGLWLVFWLVFCSAFGMIRGQLKDADPIGEETNNLQNFLGRFSD